MKAALTGCQMAKGERGEVNKRLAISCPARDVRFLSTIFLIYFPLTLLLSLHLVEFLSITVSVRLRIRIDMVCAAGVTRSLPHVSSLPNQPIWGRRQETYLMIQRRRINRIVTGRIANNNDVATWSKLVLTVDLLVSAVDGR